MRKHCTLSRKHCEWRSLIYLSFSSASEVFSSWMVDWMHSNSSACWFLTLLSSCKLRSLLWMTSAYSFLLCSKAAAVVSWFFFVGLLIFQLKHIACNTRAQFQYKEKNLKILTSVSLQRCSAIFSCWRRDSCSAFALLRTSNWWSIKAHL